jgi:hypothetical protein
MLFFLINILAYVIKQSYKLVWSVGAKVPVEDVHKHTLPVMLQPPFGPCDLEQARPLES